MALIPEWNTFREGIYMGVIGIIFAIITFFIWRKMENKAPIRITGKDLGVIVLGVLGALLLGVGMCFSMVWGNMVLGIIVGLVGIVVLLMLTPFIKGIVG